MKPLLLLVFLFGAMYNSNAQDSTFRKNSISIESGFFHRGLLGVSYTRNFLHQKFTFMSASAFGGVGLYYKRYAGGSIDFNMGKGEVFFCAGADFKSVLANDWEPLFVEGSPWQFAWEPHIGMHVITTYGFTGKLLLGYMFTNELEGGYSEVPSMGISLGYAF